jgi:transcriptional regulator with XRE-family HTH domain
MASIADKLREAREKKGLDIEDVYLATKISPNIIKALEESRAEELIGFVYTKNFLKQYAAFLGLDSGQLVADFTQKQEPKLEEKHLNIALEKPKFGKTKIFKKIFLAGLVLIVIGAFIWGLGQLIGKIRSLGGRERTAKHLEVLPEAPAFPIPATNKLKLKMTTTDEVWVQIKSDGKVINQSTLKSGTVKTWEANENFELWLGKPTAVELELNDKPLNLPKDRRIRGVVVSREGLKF